MDVDENGWAKGIVAPLPIGQAWTLLSKDTDARIDAARWAHQAETFFKARLVVVQDKRYPSGAVPLADRVEVDVGALGAASLLRVDVLTLPLDRAPQLKVAGQEGARAIGGAGFDLLVDRARRVWQVAVAGPLEGDPRGAVVVAAVLALVLLAPVIPPGGGTIFGVKGARLRLEALGWRT